ncbi:MAG: hypothetical protein IPG94_18475 [Kineosporiaceae bacterium]|nr:hypothetical protein [Kineosporiaceae bacterium]
MVTGALQDRLLVDWMLGTPLMVTVTGLPAVMVHCTDPMYTLWPCASGA